MIYKIGDLQGELAQDFRDLIDRVVNRTKLDKYYVLIRSYWDESDVADTPAARDALIHTPNAPSPGVISHRAARVLRTKAFVMRQPPAVRLLDTLLFVVDRKKGRIEMLWCLPKDTPLEAESTDSPAAEFIAKSAEGLPLN